MNSQAWRYKQSITKRFNNIIVHYSELFRGVKREVKCLQFLLTEGNQHQLKNSLGEGKGSVRMEGKLEYLDLHWSLSNSYWPHFLFEELCTIFLQHFWDGHLCYPQLPPHKLFKIQKPTNTKSLPWKIQAQNIAWIFNNVSKQPRQLLILECCGLTLNKELASFWNTSFCSVTSLFWLQVVSFVWLVLELSLGTSDKQFCPQVMGLYRTFCALLTEVYFKESF